MDKNNKVNILLVDDNPMNLFSLEQMLAKPDRVFASATNGVKALKIALHKDIDLIILDVQMPEMDGFEVAQILKTNKRTKEVPIIFATAEKKEKEFMVKGLEEGGVDYLHKPLDPRVTEAKVSVLLRLHLQRKELIAKNAALERYALLINNSADLICIINAETLKFDEINEAVNAILGYTPDEIRGSSLLFYLAEEHREKVQNLNKENKEQFSFETQIFSKNRAIKWLHWNIVNKQGIWFANARDVTEIKEVEEIRNYLAVVVKQSKDAIYLHNAEGKIISWNNGAEEIYGFTEQQALNMKIWNIVPDFLMEEAHKVVKGLLEGAQFQSLITKRITKYGKIIDVIFSASVIKDSNGTLKSVAITERNITQQLKSDQEIKQLNTELKQNLSQLEITNKEIESFSYSVSHDLRAPLRAITGYSQIILDEYDHHFDDELKRLFGVIQNSAKRMGTLIDDLLSFSRLGRRDVSKTPVDFNQLVNAVLEELPDDEKKNAQITIHPLASTEGDYSLLFQVFMNLISNAFKYSSKMDTPLVEIGYIEKEEEFVYYVKDNGAGFNEEYAGKLFGVFQRLHSDEEFKGTGLGLAIVQRIVVKHGGRVWAESEVNKGATFYFSLPKIPVKPEAI